jgi:maleylacetate reductase
MSRMASALADPDVPGAVFDLTVAIGAPTSLEAIGMRESDIPEAARRIAEAAPRNPRPVTEPEMRTLLTNAYHGRRPASGLTSQRNGSR